MTTVKSDYGFLAILSAMYIGTVLRYQTVPKYILIATGTFAVFYVLWGVFHQLKAKNFHIKIVLEYLLVALLGVAIVSTLLI